MGICKSQLSIALRYFVGASSHDIMLVHDISMTLVYLTAWEVIDVINITDLKRRWTQQGLKCGQINFRCHQRLNVQTVCDYELRFY